MLLAVLSDIHANLEALLACLQRIDELKAERIVCLGDLVGYGPNPRQVVEITKNRCASVILGNHDEALIKKPVNFNRIPSDAIYWTKKQFEDEEGKKFLDYLWSLHPVWRAGEIILSHGILHNNMSYVEEPEDVLFIFESMTLDEKICFAGHSHLPSAWYIQDGNLYIHDAVDKEPLDLKAAKKTWVNVGSVGQPRDRDPRACFATWDTVERVLRFHRVQYDIEKTANQIRKIAELDNFLADRLSQGI